MDAAGQNIIDRVYRLQLLLVGCARGGKSESENAEYMDLRGELVPVIGTRLPGIVRIYRTLPEFWRFIRPKFKSYSEREAFITKEFAALLGELEGLTDNLTATAPSTATQKEVAVATVGPLKARTVFVVHGRNEVARKALFDFLRALNLSPLEWGQAVNLTGQGAPYVGDVLDAGFAAAQATVILLTPDDEARLRVQYQGVSDGPEEKQLNGQPRQNVLFEAGMAMGMHPERSIIVEIGKLRPMSDIVGRHAVRLDDSPETRNDLVHRLRAAGCEVNTAGRDWYSAGRFNPILAAIATATE